MKKSLFIACAALALVSAPAFAQTQESADATLAAQEWEAAAADYRALLADDGENAQNWFALASALHQLEDFAGARDAYRKALDNGYTPAARAHFRLARALMSLGDEDAALEALEALIGGGGPNGNFIRATAEFEPLLENPRFLAVVKAMTPCTDDEYRHFDFWLGAWDVYGNGSETPTAKSRISSKHGGCMVLEEYEVSGGGYTGMSINYYDNVREVWHQTWMSTAGAPIYLDGKLNDAGAMVLTDADLEFSEMSGTINRVTWTPNDDGSVRQFWETSTDGGETWSVGFDGLYRPRAE